ncbi:protein DETOXIFICATION 16-like isoform X2 [Vitis riparia]|uniref:protein DETOXIFICATION 16-like isoform X2 n=1 Tax=Vitis riparia TaxID=96939 RepID=UPI00155A5182|nr:protein DETOXIFICATION 16-like isoform X2 [Vitis riparia]
MDSEEEILSLCVSDSDVDYKDLWRVEIGEEVKKQLALAGPLTIVGVLRYFTQAVSLMFVGHLGELPLASASMAASFASVTGFSLLIGMGSALDTLCGQAYGAKHYHMLGIHMQRAMSVLLLVSVPLAFIWAKTEHILMNLGQDPYISRGAGRYVWFMMPTLFSCGILQCLVRFLQTQKIVFPVMLISAITTLFHFPTCWILVFKTSFGSAGAALACSISSWINVFLLVLYVKFSPACKQTWTGVSEMNIQDVLSFLRLAVPSASMVCLTTCAMLFNIYLGIGSAGSIRISNELGAGRPQKAYLAVHAVLILANVFGMLLGSIMFLLRRTWGYLFSNKEEVVKYVASMMPLLATSALLDAIQCALSGIVRGCGWQKIGAIVNLGAYYLVGIPCALLFTFDFGLGGKGLWMGILCALFLQMLCLLVVTLQTNWEQQAKKAEAEVCRSRYMDYVLR